MSVATPEIEAGTLGLHSLDNYAPLVGAATVERILNKAERLRTLHAVHISSTFYGGGVTEISRLRERLGARAKETVRENFLMSRLMEDWIEVLGSLDQPSSPVASGRH
jgi:hypothetical protein